MSNKRDLFGTTENSFKPLEPCYTYTSSWNVPVCSSYSIPYSTGIYYPDDDRPKKPGCISGSYIPYKEKKDFTMESENLKLWGWKITPKIHYAPEIMNVCSNLADLDKYEEELIG